MPLSLHYAFGNFIENAMKNEGIIMTGSGTAMRSFMYVGDTMLWFMTQLTKIKKK
ncbi:hypothetical protein OA328_00065 [Paracoccaceae bacterium]|nr:hypothetical protein [Paracoccaceae bacterium]